MPIYEYRCQKCNDVLETDKHLAEPFYNTHYCGTEKCEGMHARHYSFGVGYTTGSGQSPSRTSVTKDE